MSFLRDAGTDNPDKMTSFQNDLKWIDKTFLQMTVAKTTPVLTILQKWPLIGWSNKDDLSNLH